jgi:hypothetical protein
VGNSPKPEAACGYEGNPEPERPAGYRRIASGSEENKTIIKKENSGPLNVIAGAGGIQRD